MTAMYVLLFFSLHEASKGMRLRNSSLHFLDFLQQIKVFCHYKDVIRPIGKRIPEANIVIIFRLFIFKRSILSLNSS